MKGLSRFGPGGLHLVFDPEDPDTPCMVYLRDRSEEGSATFWCALEEGEVEGYDLSSAQLEFLKGYEAEATAFDDAHGRKED